MSIELNAVKARIIALTQKTVDRGCTYDEAMSAMAKVGELLQAYNLTMDECDVREEKCATVELPIDGSQPGAALYDFTWELTRFFYARHWWHVHCSFKQGRYRKDYSYNFFVQQHDVEAVRYYFRHIEAAIRNETDQFRHTDAYRFAENRRVATRCFTEGMSRRIAERLKAMRQDNERAMKAARQSTGTALMVLKGQLIEEEFEKLGLRLRTGGGGYGSAYADGVASAAGRVAGGRVNLNRPVNGSGSRGLLT